MKPFLFLLFLWPFAAMAQLSDHFDDGNLTQNPAWNGTLNRFIVNTQNQLQLHDSMTDTAWISTPFPKGSSTEWQVWVKAAFSPSSHNFIRIWLAADRVDLTKPSQGFFLQLGEAGNKDAVELFRKTGDSTVSVCRGTEGAVAKPFVARFKVIRDTLGHWQLFADYSGGEDFRPEASGKDTHYGHLIYFGLYCRYTKSNANKILFDDVYAGPLQVDTIPPTVDSLTVTNDSTLILYFSESVDSLSAVDTGHYRLTPEAGILQKVKLSADAKKATLLFSRKFLQYQSYKLTVAGIKDRAGNTSETKSISFVFVRPQQNDVVFNEIMADPTPAVGLPAYEYLELYNRAPVSMNLTGWHLTMGKNTQIFGKVILPAGGYLIVCKAEAEASFASFGQVYGFRSFSLTNSGETLRLTDAGGKTIASIAYDESWYRDAEKSKGGWSLEQINPENICSGAGNWKASVDHRGGTPGVQNSVYNARIIAPGITGLQVVDKFSIKLLFSQKMDTTEISNSSFYTVLSGGLETASAVVRPDNPAVVTLRFNYAMDTGTIYRIRVAKALQNCTGEPMMADTTLRFGLPQTVQNKDVVINEVLFYPWEGGADYVELYNRSSKIIDLSSLILGTVKRVPPNPPDSLFYDLSYGQKLLFPGDFLVLTSSPQKVKAQYVIRNPHAFLQVNPFPGLKKDSGSVLLYRQLHRIDAFDYSEKMQYPLLKYTQGVALERVSADGKTNDRNNWHSAASDAGFGTPGYRNSQSAWVSPDSLQGKITITPEIFSPDNDGYQDVLHIFYHFELPDNTLTIHVFDASGHLVRNLVNNAYVGTGGEVSWDGLEEDGTKAPAGIYVFYIRVFDEKGHVRQFKKTAVLATKF
jgi:hypothetical protein